MRKARREKSALQRLLYGISHVLLGITVVVMVLTLAQCTIKKPEAPSWRTNMVVPLANKTWDMNELIRKINQENLSIDSAGNPYFYYSHLLDTVTVNGSFSVPTVSQSVSESLGVVELNPAVGQDVTINLGDYVSLQSGNVPPAAFDVSQALPALADFVTATISNGTVAIHVENDFGLDLDTVHVTVTDVVNSTQLDSYSIPGGLPSGQANTHNTNLAGRTISNQLSVLIHCHTPGATSFSLSGKTMTCSASMPNGIDVIAATAKTPEIQKSFDQAIDITSEHLLQTADISGGRVVLDLQNQTNLAANLVITLPDLKNGGDPLVVNQPVTAGQTRQFIYNLTGYTLEPSDQTLPQSLAMHVDLVVDSSGIPVTVHAGDKVHVTASVENVSFADVQGIIAPTTASFANIQQDIDIPKGFDNVQLPGAQLKLDVKNTVNIPGSFSIVVSGNNGQQKTITGTIQPGTQESPVTTIIVDNDLTAFMNPVPSQITANGSATFGDGVTTGSITPTDFVIGTITLSSPLQLIIDSTTFDGGAEGNHINFDTAAVNGLKLAQFHATVTNHLPIGVSAEFLMSGDSATLYTNPEVRLGPVVITAGTLNPDGTVAAATISQNAISMDSLMARVLLHDTLWVGELITLQSTQGSPVRLLATDSFSISGYIDVEYSFDQSVWGTK
jgi:hypothetical protein